jgi:phage FluMu protein Com
MPIRFRCQHCHQLMGIARRKAGTEVQCPTCRHNTLVPKQDEVEAEAAPRAAVQTGQAAAAGKSEPLFERSDFDEVLRGTEAPPRIARPAPKKDLGGPRPGDAAPGLAPVAQSPASLPAASVSANGIFLTSNQATLLAVAAILLLAVAFGAGLLVGRYCFGG